ncbi:tRNA (mo5U34)-methyltransferase [Raoultella terrigena]|uniref:tRNA (Mo5U34)-methyltransferase n=1 Tax=Raoultella terrigena TaxID=577 RepID=A0A3P8IW28_RAOTE|nr:tRNA (mo5U34)-methyltransferase [Raoultella terrigena]
MIDFSNFYQHIAKGPLSHWLETLPAQVAAWQREALHGKYREWERPLSFSLIFRPIVLTCCTA